MHATRLVPVCLSILVGCGANVVAPPAAPMPDMPRVPDARKSPPAEGETRVTLDANGEKAVVTETLATVSTNETANVQGHIVNFHGATDVSKTVCVTPWQVDLKPGSHVLNFASKEDAERTSSLTVQVGDNPKVVRHAIGRHEGTSGAHIAFSLLTTFAIAGVVTGGTIWGVGSAMPDRDDSHRNADFANVGKYVLIGSAAAMTIGIVGQLLTRPVSQEGATTEIASR